MCMPWNRTTRMRPSVIAESNRRAQSHTPEAVAPLLMALQFVPVGIPTVKILNNLRLIAPSPQPHNRRDRRHHIRESAPCRHRKICNNHSNIYFPLRSASVIIDPTARPFFPVCIISLYDFPDSTFKYHLERLPRLAEMKRDIRQRIPLHQVMYRLALHRRQVGTLNQRIKIRVYAKHVFIQRKYAVCRK